jgi:hypothetical protein
MNRKAQRGKKRAAYRAMIFNTVCGSTGLEFRIYAVWCSANPSRLKSELQT